MSAISPFSTTSFDDFHHFALHQRHIARVRELDRRLERVPRPRRRR